VALIQCSGPPPLWIDHVKPINISPCQWVVLIGIGTAGTVQSISQSCCYDVRHVDASKTQTLLCKKEKLKKQRQRAEVEIQVCVMESFAADEGSNTEIL